MVDQIQFTKLDSHGELGNEKVKQYLKANPYQAVVDIEEGHFDVSLYRITKKPLSVLSYFLEVDQRFDEEIEANDKLMKFMVDETCSPVPFFARFMSINSAGHLNVYISPSPSSVIIFRKVGILHHEAAPHFAFRSTHTQIVAKYGSKWQVTINHPVKQTDLIIERSLKSTQDGRYNRLCTSKDYTVVLT